MHLGLIRSCLVLIALGCVGCRPRSDDQSELPMEKASLQVVSGSQLSAFVRQSEQPVLVEFGVDYNCSRCQQTKSGIIALSEQLDPTVKVVRVDFNANAAMVAQLGGSICPTYVLFQNGEPVLSRSFPLSMDLLRSEVETLTRR